MKLLLTGAPRVLVLLVLVLGVGVMTSYADLPTKKYLNLAAIKVMVAGAEAEAQRLHVDVTICVVDESGNLLFLQKADSAPLNTIIVGAEKGPARCVLQEPFERRCRNI